MRINLQAILRHLLKRANPWRGYNGKRSGALRARVVERERQQKRPELEARLREVAAERERLEDESRNLASAAAEAKTGRQAFYARLGEIHVALEAKETE
jgi:hypothetical protein